MADFNQPLNTQQPDLGTLFQYLPEIAAGQVGTMQRQADQNTQSLQDAFAAQQAHNAQTRPLDLQQLTANIGNTNAMTGLHNASARSTNLASDITEATKQGTIGATNAANKTKVGEADIAQTEQMGQLFGQVAAETSSVPPMMRAQIAKRRLASLIPEHPELEDLLITHANDLPEFFKSMSDKMFSNSTAARTAAALAAREKEKIGMQGENNLRVAQTTGEYRVAAKEAGAKPLPSEAELVSKHGYTGAANYYYQKADDAKASGDKDKEELYRAKADKMKMANERAIILRAAAAGGGKVDLTKLGLETNPAAQPEGFNNTQAPKPKPPPNIFTITDLRAAHPEYKDKTDDELKTNWKTKFGVDLK